MMTEKSEQTPAYFGGMPVEPAGPPPWPVPDPSIASVLQMVAEDGSWGRYHGPHLERLCSWISEFHATEHVVACASGTAAVELALRGLNIGPCHEVLLSAYDFQGNFRDVLTVGATPVLIDVEPHTGQIDLAQLPLGISPQTRAILVSHLHGGLIDMSRLMAIAREHNLPVIEDACQMPGALVVGRLAGTWGDVGVWSFGGSKLLSAGRGGALFTNRGEIAQRIRLYTQRGNEAYPLSEIQAALLLPQCEQLVANNTRRLQRMEELQMEWERTVPALSGLTPFQMSVPDSQPGYYKYGLWYEPEAWGGMSREDFCAAMRAEGFALDPGFRSLHAIHSRSRFRTVGELSNATRADGGIVVWHHPWLIACGLESVKKACNALSRLQAFVRQRKS